MNIDSSPERETRPSADGPSRIDLLEKRFFQLHSMEAKESVETVGPLRIQRRRTKGWKTPICRCGCGQPARYVGRGTKWGNPAVVKKGERHSEHEMWLVRSITGLVKTFVEGLNCVDPRAAAYEEAVLWFANGYVDDFEDEELEELRGHDLMCWCPSDLPCHADVLIEIANAPRGGGND